MIQLASRRIATCMARMGTTQCSWPRHLAIGAEGVLATLLQRVAPSTRKINPFGQRHGRLEVRSVQSMQT